ncbi:hypothetical protein [Algoriphagus terrigena]|uniref:hypothetical protein n=1 Tax=Algoriphagus terrigena TaxID=344884 RepID=UPI0004287854|nr:hypothetical protein [Algoriphagus terrigena]
MNSASSAPKKKWSTAKKILAAVGIIIVVAGTLIYFNFNKILSTALSKSFESSLMSEVYELKFENLRLNPLQGSISVYNVSFEPRATSDYPYINSFIRMRTESLVLEHVDIRRLLEFHELVLDKISIKKPNLELDVNGSNPILFPFKPSKSSEEAGKKRSLESYFLNEFELVDASFHVVNSIKQRDFTIENFNVSLHGLLIDQEEGKDIYSLKNIDISLEKFTGNLNDGPMKHAKFRDFRLMFDSINVHKNLDTLIFKFRDMQTGIDSLDVYTKDSMFHLQMDVFTLGYLDRSILLKGMSFKPFRTNAEIQKNYQHQHADFSGTVASLSILGMNFDSLMYGEKIFIDEVLLDSVSASIYKDNTKPKDMNKFPEYLGQTVAKIETPLLIKSVKVTHVNLINEERKPDGTTAKVHINNGTVEVKNITNLAPEEELELSATAYLAGKVETILNLKFSYSKPQFSFHGRLSPFELSHLNPIIKAYTPAEIKSGVADEINFTGIATRTAATGTMKFLYHDLAIDLQLKEQAKWKSSVVTFGANTALISKNPISETAPERTVAFTAERDMNKGFVNLIIKSALDGMKETMIMSKNNRREFNHLKKEVKREARKEAKKEKN